MYNTKLVCSYNTSEVFIETDDISEEEKDFIRDSLYRQELLDILGIEEYNEDEIIVSIHDLYSKLENCNELKECMGIMAGKFMSEDLEFGLMILFAYDCMYLSHICICEYLEKGSISEINICKLKDVIHL
jgi:hypothetical protein